MPCEAVTLLANYDLGDITTLVDERTELAGRDVAAAADQRSYPPTGIEPLLQTPLCIDAPMPHLPNDAAIQIYLPIILE